MAKMTQWYYTPTFRMKDKSLAESAMGFAASASNSDQWTRFSIRVRNILDDSSVNLELDRDEAQKVVDTLTRYLTEGPRL